MAAERCQLPNTIKSDKSDAEGIFWDTGLPDECHKCLIKALQGKNVKTEYFEPLLDADEDEDMLDRYLVNGIRRVDCGSERFGVQEHGIDEDGSNEGPLYYRSEVTFHCPKN